MYLGIDIGTSEVKALLLGANHQVIGSSQMYASEASRDNGIASVKTNGVSTTVKSSV